MNTRGIATEGMALGLIVALAAWIGPQGVTPCGTGPGDLGTGCTILGASDMEAQSGEELGERSSGPSLSHGLGEPPSTALDASVPAPDRGPTAERAAAEMASALARHPGAPSPTGEAQARMTRAERDAFRMAAQGCWDYDPASPAGRSTVTVGFDLDPEGRVTGPVDLIWHDAPTSDAADEAFEAARQAILGCQTHAVPLPPESHEQSRYAEMTFEAPTRAIR